MRNALLGLGAPANGMMSVSRRTPIGIGGGGGGPSSITRLGIADWTYAGGWRYPPGDLRATHGIRFQGAADKLQGIFVRTGSGTILRSGHLGQSETSVLAEMNIPAGLVNSTSRVTSELPEASFATDGVNIAKDYAWLSHQAPSVANRGWELFGFVESTLWNNEKWILACSRFFYNQEDPPLDDLPAVFATKFPTIPTPNPKGYWRVGEADTFPYDNKKTAGYMGEIPVELRPLFGGHTHWCGCFVRQGSSRTSHGPAFYAFTPPADPDAAEGTVMDASPGLYYPESAPFDGGYASQLSIPRPWQAQDGLNCAALVYTSSGKGAMVYFAHRSWCPYMYGNYNVAGERATIQADAEANAIARGLTGSDIDTAKVECFRTPSKGYQGGPDEVHAICYDLEEIAAAVRGERSPTSISPYEVIVFNRTLFSDPATGTNEPTTSSGVLKFWDEYHSPIGFPFRLPAFYRFPQPTAGHFVPEEDTLYIDESHACEPNADHPVTHSFQFAA